VLAVAGIAVFDGVIDGLCDGKPVVDCVELTDGVGVDVDVTCDADAVGVVADEDVGVWDC